MLFIVLLIALIFGIRFYNSTTYTDSDTLQFYEDNGLFFTTARYFIPTCLEESIDQAADYQHKKLRAREYISIELVKETLSYEQALAELREDIGIYPALQSDNTSCHIEQCEGFILNNTEFICYLVIVDGHYFAIALGQNYTTGSITYLFVEDNYFSHTMPGDCISSYYP